jgi:hypothetical protein
MPLHWTISHPSKLVLAFAKGVVQPVEIFARTATANRPIRIFVEEHLARKWLDEVAPVPCGNEGAGAASR